MLFGKEFLPSLQPSPPSSATIPAEPVSCPATPVTKYQRNAEVERNFFFYQVPPLHAALWQSRSKPSRLSAGAAMNGHSTPGLDRTRLAYARRTRHEAGALNKRNLVECQRRNALLQISAHAGSTGERNVIALRNYRNAASRPSIYQAVTDRIISSLKAGVIPWEKPWKAPHFTGGPFPRNFRTGKPYRGINVLLLWSVPTTLHSGLPSSRRRS